MIKKDQHLELLKELISIKSLSGHEDKLGERVDSWFKKRGIKTIKQGSNVVVYFKGRLRNKVFIFNSHLDTVGPGEKKWRYGPWNPTMEGKRLIGLGASDMKAGLVASMFLAAQWVKEKPPADAFFTYVVREELDGLGTASFADWFKSKGYLKKYQDKAAIFTEPTNLKEIEHGHRGNLFVKAITCGDSGHSSRPGQIKTHAVKKMIEFSRLLAKACQKWNVKHKSRYFKPAITLGEFTSIKAGVVVDKDKIVVESPNKFPSSCEATFDVRTVASFHSQALKEIKRVGQKMGVKVTLECPDGPAGFTDPEEKIVEVAKKEIKNPELTTSQGSADLGFLTKIGVKAIIFGPGESKQAHQADEYCYPEQIPQAVRIYKKIFEEWSR